MNSKDIVQLQLIGLCAQLPYPLILCENISHEHFGHAGAHAHSHFRLSFKACFHSIQERLAAHKEVMKAVAPLIEDATIHSVILVFDKN